MMSSSRTSRFIGPILQWIDPDVSDATIRGVQLVVRKGAHVTEYAILALLLYRALRRTAQKPSTEWCRNCAYWAWMLAFAYAASDEWHQSFVPSRGGSVHDVLIDACGAALGLLFCHGWLLYQNDRKLKVRA
jgi:VanZ family protein